ncbi:glycoside hydrolase domain-containing protein [Streptomyces sp. NPDC058374]|uniref:glycoside hydrolase domain-containing protein n=1 Tax=Streptomyces sp. NPDC058374 TaxID=3346466 RepID=UPI003646E093
MRRQMMIRGWVALAAVVAAVATGTGATGAYGDAPDRPRVSADQGVELPDGSGALSAPGQAFGDAVPGLASSGTEFAPPAPPVLPARADVDAPAPLAASAPDTPPSGSATRPAHGPQSQQAPSASQAQAPLQPAPGEVEFPPSWPLPGVGFGAPAQANVFRGKAFDTCRTPSIGVLRDWSASDYRGVGVYFGGRGRACPDQPHLTREWLGEADSLGWSVLPIYVGSQSPCVGAANKQHVRISGDPGKQGAEEGADAVARAAALGMGKGSALYLDMEAYDHRKAACAATTLAFVRAWNRTVTDSGYLPGFYSSASSGITHLESERRAGTTDLPVAVWFARWQEKADLWGEPVLARDAWAPDGRVHQYTGNVQETHGGSTLTIDRNLVSAPVARIG